jgi:hypothetical protein
VLEGAAGEAFAARTVGLRVFAVATPAGWRVMPGRPDPGRRRGGLARHRDAARRPLQGHLGALGRAGQRRVLAALADRDAENLVDSNATLASRAAENLFWFGRYGERCDGSVRLLRVALGHVLDDSGGRSGGVPPAWELARQLGLIDSTAKNVPRQLRRAATSPRRRSTSGCASSRALPSACATGCRPTTGARSTA